MWWFLSLKSLFSETVSGKALQELLHDCVHLAPIAPPPGPRFFRPQNLLLHDTVRQRGRKQPLLTFSSRPFVLNTSCARTKVHKMIRCSFSKWRVAGTGSDAS